MAAALEAEATTALDRMRIGLNFKLGVLWLLFWRELLTEKRRRPEKEMPTEPGDAGQPL